MYSVSSRSAWVLPLPFSTARAGRDNSTVGKEISVTLCQSVVLAPSVTPWAETYVSSSAAYSRTRSLRAVSLRAYQPESSSRGIFTARRTVRETCSGFSPPQVTYRLPPRGVF